MQFMENNFNRKHAFVFIGILILFSIANFLISNAGIDDRQNHHKLVFYTTAGTIMGPMTGAISRNWQGCCTRFSLSLLPFCGPFLLAGVLAQFIRLPFRKGAAALRMSAWIIGLLGWFLGGLLSYAHAFS